jgi:hypothetical protein
MTVAELLVAAGITMALVATSAGVATSVQQLFDTAPEVADMQQRLRVAADALGKDLASAVAPVMPYRAGAGGQDPDFGTFYRQDAITLLSPSWGGGAITSHAYYLRGGETGAGQLRRYDGVDADFPLVDGVGLLRFEYFDASGASIEPAALADGPWFPDEHDAHRFDADLLRIRRVRVTLRAEPRTGLGARLQGREIRFDVSPRNIDHD